MMKLKCLCVILVAVLVAQFGYCGLIAQCENVFGEPVSAGNIKTNKNAPQQAAHQNNRGKWELSNFRLPSLRELQQFYQDPMPIYGMYLDASIYLKYRKDINEVGFKTFRIWNGESQSQDLFDRCIKAMIEDGACPMPVLGAKKRDDFKTDQQFIANALKTFKKFIDRYGPDGSFFKDYPEVEYKPITHFQVWNEPNFQYMYLGDGTNKMIPVRHKLYAELLVQTYKMIKQNWPEITVIGWTCGGAAAQDSYFVSNAIKHNPKVAQSFDVFSTHPYVSPVPPEAYAVQGWGKYSIASQLAAVRKHFANAGRKSSTLPVWYTEGGWRITHEDGGMSKTGFIPALLHGAYYVRYYAMGVRLGVNRIMPMYAVDADGFNGGFFNRTEKWMRVASNPKRPAALATQNMIKLMPNPKLKRIISDGGDFYCYEFLTDKLQENPTTAIMAWKVTAGGENREIRVNFENAVITDMMGNTEPAEVINGKVTVEVGPYPIYITAAK